MFRLPDAAEPLLSRLSIAFTRPTFQRMLVLSVGSVLALGRQTVTGALRAAGGLAAGHHTSFHRVLSRARWSLWPLARALAAIVLELVPEGEPVICSADDTTPQHKGKHVWGKGRHRDNCRSTRSHTVWVFGHKWVVLAVNVKFAFASRPWALPLLAALYHAPDDDRRRGKRHRTPADLARGLMLMLLRWFPDRRFILLGDVRTGPCLLGLFSLVCLIYHRHTGGKGSRAAGAAWYAKTEPTFSDAIATVRRLLWSETILKEADHHKTFEKLRPEIRTLLLDRLSPAA
jgi:hypothetical protein